jgi:hypothetical protein
MSNWRKKIKSLRGAFSNQGAPGRRCIVHSIPGLFVGVSHGIACSIKGQGQQGKSKVREGRYNRKNAEVFFLFSS